MRTFAFYGDFDCVWPLPRSVVYLSIIRSNYEITIRSYTCGLDTNEQPRRTEVRTAQVDEREERQVYTRASTRLNAARDDDERTYWLNVYMLAFSTAINPICVEAQ